MSERRWVNSRSSGSPNNLYDRCNGENGAHANAGTREATARAAGARRDPRGMRNTHCCLYITSALQDVLLYKQKRLLDNACTYVKVSCPLRKTHRSDHVSRNSSPARNQEPSFATAGGARSQGGSRGRQNPLRVLPHVTFIKPGYVASLPAPGHHR